jgi:hypothetical protein
LTFGDFALPKSGLSLFSLSSSTSKETNDTIKVHCLVRLLAVMDIPTIVILHLLACLLVFGCLAKFKKVSPAPVKSPSVTAGYDKKRNHFAQNVRPN